MHSKFLRSAFFKPLRAPRSSSAIHTAPVSWATGTRENEFFTLGGQPQIHVLQGFSKFKPPQQVIQTIRDKVSHPTTVSFPSVEVRPEALKHFSAPSAALHSVRYFSSETAYSRPVAIPSPQEAFFVLDLDRVRQKTRHWFQCFPDIMPHYAVKANPNPDVVRLMTHELGLSFDCASRSEISLALEQGATPDSIIFANPCKSLADIDFARRVGVRKTTFDSEAELLKIKAVHPHAQVLLRVWVDDKDAQCQLSNKYGAHAHEVDYLLALAQHLQLELIGVSFHVGSGGSATAYREALDSAYQTFQKGLSIGLPMRMLDIGGGFPGTDSEEGVSLAQIAQLVRPSLDKYWKGVQIIAEPGRYFCSEAQTLAAQVIGKRVRPKDGSMRREYTINDGLYQSFNCMLYDHSVLVTEPGAAGALSSTHQPKHSSTIFGQTCDGLDTISNDMLLPELYVGDWLAVPAIGAYSNGASSTFNGFPLNQCVVLNQTSALEG